MPANASVLAEGVLSSAEDQPGVVESQAVVDAVHVEADQGGAGRVHRGRGRRRGRVWSVNLDGRGVGHGTICEDAAIHFTIIASV